jgi:hypothetical protein
MGRGFRHHGVATPVSNCRGLVCTVDGDGRDVVLAWLFDHRGGYAILVVDAETGEAREVPSPFTFAGDCPYASILSSKNRYYTHFAGHFSEFDPVAGSFTFESETVPQMAMSMTEDDRGVIWSATYPSSGLASYDPTTGDFTDHGHLYEQDWRQYPRGIAADAAGWVYFAVGYTSSQIIAFDPATGSSLPLLSESERRQDCASVYRDVDGKVYGRSSEKDDGGWMELFEGRRSDLHGSPPGNLKPIIAGHQGLFHDLFPCGRRLSVFDLVEGVMTVDDPGGERHEGRFTYSSEGAHLMGVMAEPAGGICGGTAFPMRFFHYGPDDDRWINREAFGQFNTVARTGDRVFFGSYGGGVLLEWDPSAEWVHSEEGIVNSNPRVLYTCTPAIHRPHALLAHTDGRNVVMGGTPGYGYTGGGLLFWDRETGIPTLLEHTDILPEHSTMSLVALPDGKLLGGSTTAPGTGGEQKALIAELYVMNIESKAVEWHEPLLEGVQNYADMQIVETGLVYGIADRTHFFVFDPVDHRIVHHEDIGEALGQTVWQQGPRILLPGNDGVIYVLLEGGIARIDTSPYRISMVEDSPVRISAGGDILDGRIYFASGSHLHSWDITT